MSMASMIPPFPPSGQYLQSIRESCHALRVASNIKIERSSIERLLRSQSFTESFQRVSKIHGLAFPLQFPSVVSELNLLSIMSLLNFASGYRVPLHEQTGRGAWDNIRAFTFSLFLASSTEFDWLSARGMQAVTEGIVAEHLRVSVHVERPHETLPGVTVGDLGGPMHRLVQLIANTLKETGEILQKSGYPDLGTFVLEALRTGEKVHASKGEGVDVDAVLEQIVKAIPGFRDMSVVNGQPVYVFKKALFLLHAIKLRFGSTQPTKVPIPDTSTLPIFSDNVVPSLLTHLGVIDLSDALQNLSSKFPVKAEALDTLLASVDTLRNSGNIIAALPKDPPKDGPVLTEEQAYVIRAAAIDACEQIVETARVLEGAPQWVQSLKLPELDMWIWAVAKDRSDYRQLGRFVLRDTIMF